MQRLRVLAVAGCLVLSACSGGGGGSSSPSASVRPLPVILEPDDPSIPYGITAIDYHFHDAHPSRPLTPHRAVIWTNQGSVLHNVTIPQLGFSKDLPVGASIEIRSLGKKLGGPGVYTFFCKYHAQLGMRGTIIIA